MSLLKEGKSNPALSVIFHFCEIPKYSQKNLNYSLIEWVLVATLAEHFSIHAIKVESANLSAF